MTDDQDLTQVRHSFTALLDSLDGVRLEQPAETMMASGRSRRLRRRLTGLAGVATALAVALAVALPSSGHPGGTGPAPAHPDGLVHLNLAAWSVNQRADGTVALSLHELKDAAALQRALARAGVPAVVTFNKDCWSQRHRPATGVLGNGPAGQTIIRPSAIPKGWEVNFDVIAMRDARVASFVFGLVPIGAHLTCSAP